MIEGVELDDGEYGVRAAITSAWTEAMADVLLKNKVVELELNQGKGWRGRDLSFLAGLPGLKSLTVHDFTVPSVEPVHRLPHLRQLTVSTYCDSEINFATFPELERCSLEWRRGAASVFDCGTLKHLFVNRYNGTAFEPFSRLRRLESLAILNSPLASLEGIGALASLRSLRLASLRKLTSLAGLEAVKGLEELNIHTCRRVSTIDEIGHLRRLRRLSLNNSGAIASLRALNTLDSLEFVSFYESTTIVDGDLSPLLRQPHLERVAFMNRRHYSHKREDFDADNRA